MYKLVKPQMKHKKAFLDYIRDWEKRIYHTGHI